MLLLLLFAAIAGAGTALSPCVLPILPAVLSAGLAGGRRRPLGVAIGLVLSFALAIALLSELLANLGLGDGTLRTLGIAVVAAAGVTLLAPRLAHAVSAALAPLVRRVPAARGEGFWSGLAVGAALGAVYTPCAGPILAAVIAVGAASSQRVPIAFAYALGSGAVLLAIAVGGRRVTARARGPVLQRVLGGVLVVTAVAMAAGLDTRFEAALARHVPAALIDPTGALERSGAVQRRLAAIDDRRPPARAARPGRPARPAGHLADMGRAPRITAGGSWLNTPGDRPLGAADLRGHVVLVDFWTYTCINCLRTLPYLEAWDSRYRRAGLIVLGVHTPEFTFERSTANVADAVRRLGVRYPVVQDNARATWDAWRVDAWPTEFLVDRRGHVRSASVGEGGYDETEREIRTLLGERAGRRAHVGAVEVPSAVATPETYLGAGRAEGWLPIEPQPGLRTYPGVPARLLRVDRFALRGTWRVGEEAAEAVAGARIDAHVRAKSVYLVLGSRGERPRRVTVALDGRPIDAARAGADVHHGVVTVRRQRLYRLVGLPRLERHRLTLRLAPGVSGYAFTFG